MYREIENRKNEVSPDESEPDPGIVSVKGEVYLNGKKIR